ncbi:unnamed protein product [Candidula unifasciata]|uniref:Uncharacterized protein n=1 Tax=Candidula unifasciata TaxID=100452 RepID=A0A8S4A491_9EUPU|nr:unnamed protein product [Candidula unifasciata]
MRIARQAPNQSVIFLAILLTVSLVLQFARADDDEEGCGHGCQSMDPDPSQMSRCVRYACRRRVFRYFIRFGKRSGSDLTQEQQLKNQLISRLQKYSRGEDGALGNLEMGLSQGQQGSTGSEVVKQLASSWQNAEKQSRENKLINMLLNIA